MKYMVIMESTPTDLSTSVSTMIPCGWFPQGGVAMSIKLDETGYIFAQAMIKEDKKS